MRRTFRKNQIGESPLQQELRWWKSSYSGQNGGDCIECAVTPSTADVVFVRDSKERDGARLAFTKEAWNSFVGATTTNSFGRVRQ
ncbi:DUF397 domain-containing protein [Streptomyces avermitilis]|uniref:DUF397 domain-containing protein n=1 Tax=Streptomyces avermitilis TaxID=33903 RepID=UPI00339FFE54